MFPPMLPKPLTDDLALFFCIIFVSPSAKATVANEPATRAAATITAAIANVEDVLFMSVIVYFTSILYLWNKILIFTYRRILFKNLLNWTRFLFQVTVIEKFIYGGKMIFVEI
jgi:hypothetical protein